MDRGIFLVWGFVVRDRVMLVLGYIDSFFCKFFNWSFFIVRSVCGLRFKGYCFLFIGEGL